MLVLVELICARRSYAFSVYAEQFLDESGRGDDRYRLKEWIDKNMNQEQLVETMGRIRNAESDGFRFRSGSRNRRPALCRSFAS